MARERNMFLYDQSEAFKTRHRTITDRDIARIADSLGIGICREPSWAIYINAVRQLSCDEHVHHQL